MRLARAQLLCNNRCPNSSSYLLRGLAIILVSFKFIHLSHLLNRVSCGGDGCQDRFVLPLYIGQDAPVETQNGHQDENYDPEDSSKPGLVREEHVDQSLKQSTN